MRKCADGRRVIGGQAAEGVFAWARSLASLLPCLLFFAPALARAEMQPPFILINIMEQSPATAAEIKTLTKRSEGWSPIQMSHDDQVYDLSTYTLWTRIDDGELSVITGLMLMETGHMGISLMTSPEELPLFESAVVDLVAGAMFSAGLAYDPRPRGRALAEAGSGQGSALAAKTHGRIIGIISGLLIVLGWRMSRRAESRKAESFIQAGTMVASIAVILLLNMGMPIQASHAAGETWLIVPFATWLIRKTLGRPNDRVEGNGKSTSAGPVRELGAAVLTSTSSR